MHEEVSTVIPGASRVQQLLDNIKASDLPPLAEDEMKMVTELYDRKLREIIHPQW